jgi:hypothetical protein
MIAPKLLCLSQISLSCKSQEVLQTGTKNNTTGEIWDPANPHLVQR